MRHTAKAIRTARQSGDRLVFVYVIHPKTLGDEAEEGNQAAENEIRWFAKALLNIAKRRGARQGLQVDTVVRKGEVAQEIEQVIRQYQAAKLLIGQPATENGRSGRLESPELEKFMDRITRNTGAEVIVFQPEKT